MPILNLSEKDMKDFSLFFQNTLAIVFLKALFLIPCSLDHSHCYIGWIFNIHLSLKVSYFLVYRLRKIYIKLVSSVILVQRLIAFLRELIYR